MTEDEPVHPADAGPRPAAYALAGTLSLQGPWSETELRAAVDGFLSELTRTLQEAGCVLIGHIKGILEAGGKGHLFFSVTSFEEKARYKGRLTGNFAKVDLSLNVIVYGVGSEGIEQLVLAGLRKHLGEVLHDSK